MKGKMITRHEIEKLESWAKGHEPESLEVDAREFVIGEETFSVEGRAALSALNEPDRKVILALIENCFTEEPLSNVEIALKAGVETRDIPIIRCRPGFGEALWHLLGEAMRNYSDLVIGHLFRQSAQGRTTASKVFFEITGMYRPISRTMSLVYQAGARDLRGVSAEEMRRIVVEDWKKQGWEKEEFEQLWEGGEEDISKDSER